MFVSMKERCEWQQRGGAGRWSLLACYPTSWVKNIRRPSSDLSKGEQKCGISLKKLLWIGVGFRNCWRGLVRKTNKFGLVKKYIAVTGKAVKGYEIDRKIRLLKFEEKWYWWNWKEYNIAKIKTDVLHCWNIPLDEIIVIIHNIK